MGKCRMATKRPKKTEAFLWGRSWSAFDSRLWELFEKYYLAVYPAESQHLKRSKYVEKWEITEVTKFGVSHPAQYNWGPKKKWFDKTLSKNKVLLLIDRASLLKGQAKPWQSFLLNNSSSNTSILPPWLMAPICPDPTHPTFLQGHFIWIEQLAYLF